MATGAPLSLRYHSDQLNNKVHATNQLGFVARVTTTQKLPGNDLIIIFQCSPEKCLLCSVPIYSERSHDMLTHNSVLTLFSSWVFKGNCLSSK